MNYQISEKDRVLIGKTFNKIAIILVGFLLSFVCFQNIGFAYSDVPSDSINLKAIDYITGLKITKGYDDGTFHPNASVSRAEFMKIVISAKADVNFKEVPADCFKDVKKSQWFSPYICYAKDQKIVGGYPDGTFAPGNPISIIEAAKILTSILGDGKALKEGKYWYSSYVQYLSDNKYIPASIHYTNQEVTRGEVAEMIWRMMKQINNLSSVETAVLENNYCQKSLENIPNNIDMKKVRETWLSWYNDVRENQKLDPYVYNVQLNRTATVWSEYAEKRGYMSHKRDGQTAYYDYNKIKSWFKNLGLEFQNVQSITFTENINWGYYKCPAGDCTQGLIDGIKTGFDFFMSEKGKKYSPHYDSIINSHFKEIGLGIAVDPVNKKYYLTVHYGTAITSKPLPACK